MKLLANILCFLYLVVRVQVYYGSERHLVATRNGLVEGRKAHAADTGKVYYSYTGIPFAKPPIGNLRFEPPQPIGNWVGILDATKEKDICVQSTMTAVRTTKIVGSEDCLYLNIYTPVSPVEGLVKEPLAVMVWIFGGGFVEGDITYELYAPDRLINDDVIIVPIAYRLGLFGFLSTGDLVNPGNNGLRDQILGLKWVKDNIAAFGGDPNRITIFGESAGGASVSYLTQTPLTAGLYNQAIMQSGVAHCIWALSTTTSEVAYNVTELLGINVSSSAELKEKLKAVDYKKLHAASDVALYRILGGNPLSGLPHGPVIEPEHPGAVVTKTSLEALASGDFNLTPMMIGFNSLEANSFASINQVVKLFLSKTKLESSSLVPGNFNIKNDVVRAVVGNLIKCRYFGNVLSETYTDEQYLPYLSDVFFIINILEAASIASLYTNVYLYQLSYIGVLGNPLREFEYGVGHAEDLNYLFRRITSPKVLSSSDIQVSHMMVRLWTNFAKYGNPTPQAEPLLQNIIWPRTDEYLSYLNINQTLGINTNPRGDNYVFWINLYNKYRETH